MWDRGIIIRVAVAVPLIGILSDAADRFLQTGRLSADFWPSPNFIIWTYWALFFPLVLLLDERMHSRATRIAAHILGYSCFLGGHIALTVVVNWYDMGQLMESGRLTHYIFTQRVPRHFPFDLAVYVLSLAAAHVLRAQRELHRREADEARLRAELLRAEVELVKAHLDPAFLLGELKTIAATIESDPRGAERRIETLSDFLDLKLAELGAFEPADTTAPAEVLRTWRYVALFAIPVVFSALAVSPGMAVGLAQGRFDAQRLLHAGFHALLLTATIPVILAAAAPRFAGVLARIAHALAVIVLCLALATGVEWLFVRTVAGEEEAARAIVSRGVTINRFLFLGIAGFVFAAHHQRRIRERAGAADDIRARLADAQLRALKMQLHPHFLFNTLNAIAGMLEDDPAAARLMTERLESFLRASLSSGETREVRLREELEFVLTYLEIQRARFGERMRIDVEIAELVLDARVPALVLQPIVENAVRHGIAPKKGHGTISLSAAAEGDMLVIQVRDDGIGVTPESLSPGLGLSNTAARLRQLYGARQSMTFRGIAGNGFTVELLLPLQADA